VAAAGQMSYRREIDGLRAIALIPVMLFHAGYQWFGGGFVGVDVFFVISGYLITSLIMTEREAGTFSVADFYERRARRILPSLCAVMAACVPFAWWWMVPDQLEDWSNSLVWVSLFLSNIYFASETGYFAADAEDKPLLHTWSLAVEEQYYLIWPLLLIAFGFRKSWQLATLGMAGFASLAYADWQAGAGHQAAFYETTGRLWELLLGAFVALYQRSRAGRDFPIGMRQIGSAVGFALIMYAIGAFDKSTPFPSRYALSPTVGAASIILFATPQTAVGRLLASNVLVGVGLISYSTYLWHQPLLAFARLRFAGEPSQWLMGLLIAGALALGYVSWRLVERPFRAKNTLSRSTVLLSGILLSASMMTVGLLGMTHAGYPERFAPRDLELFVSPAASTAYINERHGLWRGDNGFVGKTPKRLAIIGDSFSMDVANMVAEARVFRGYEIRTLYIPYRCQLYVGDEDISRYIEKGDEPLCRDDFATPLKRLASQAQVVILASRWKDWAVDRLPGTIERLALREGASVIVFGPKHFGTIRPSAYVGTTVDQRVRLKNPIDERFIAINERMKQGLHDYNFVDVLGLLCGEGATACPIFTDEGKLISPDGGHLTPQGAGYVGRKVFALPVFSRML
jgi:peptidoglycan/LPS O-acetylase OafA/YrhL